MTGLRYLRTRSRTRADLGRKHQRFAAIRDEFIVNLRYNTARAYASDLDHLFDWALAHNKDVLNLDGQDLELYLSGLLQRPYTSNTIVRKRTALRGFYDLAVAKRALQTSPMNSWEGVKRRSPIVHASGHSAASLGATRRGLTAAGQPGVLASSATPTELSIPDTSR